MSAEWAISGPIDYSWTPEECAQIARAAQVFLAALPSVGALTHLVRLDGVGVIGGNFEVDWPQPMQVAPDPGWPAAHPA